MAAQNKPPEHNPPPTPSAMSFRVWNFVVPAAMLGFFLGAIGVASVDSQLAGVVLRSVLNPEMWRHLGVGAVAGSAAVAACVFGAYIVAGFATKQWLRVAMVVFAFLVGLGWYAVITLSLVVSAVN